MIDYETCPKCSKLGLSYVGKSESGNSYYGCASCKTVFNEGVLLEVKASKKASREAPRGILR